MIKQTKGNKGQNRTNISKQKKSESRISKDSNMSSVSVITKTTNPNVVIQAEKIESGNLTKTNEEKSQIFTQVCMLVLGIIILLTFFLSFKTYQIVSHNDNEIYKISGTNTRS